MASEFKPIRSIVRITLLIIAVFITTTSPGSALDTDIYALDPTPNVAILFDTSGSMRFGLYNNQIDYKAIYLYACKTPINLEDGASYTAHDRNNKAGDGDGPGEDNKYYDFLKDSISPYDLARDEIVLIRGNTGFYKTERTVDSKTIMTAITGDPGDPETTWFFDEIVSTGTTLAGLESGDVSADSRLTLLPNEKGVEIQFDGESLPLGQKINLHEPSELEGFAARDPGFAGSIKSLGHYFSGYEDVTKNALIEATEKDASESPETVYFLASANWVYMMLAYQLYTKDVTPDFPEDSVLQNKSFPTGDIWREETLSNKITSPDYPNDYPSNQSGTTPIGEIIVTAKRMKIHFTELILADNNDFITIADATTGNIKTIIYGPEDLDDDYWSEEITLDAVGNGLAVYFTSDSDESTVAKGFNIDSYTYYVLSGEYKLNTRLNAIQDAILGVIDSPFIKGKVNWALANIKSDDGADVWQPLNSYHANDDANRKSLEKHLRSLEGEGNSPLGESLQDIFKHFVDKGKNNKLGACSQQFCIVISDGFPSEDNEWSRITDKIVSEGVTIADGDGDGWQSDPSRSSIEENFSDDVARYMYSHTFKNNIGTGAGDDIAENERAASYHNIKTHTLSFTQSVPLLADIAKDGGGEYLTANDREQLIQSLLYLAMMAIKSTSYVAPVISVDTANKTQSGEWLYMAFFKPNQNSRWDGNLKKYRLVLKKKSDCDNRPPREWVICDQKTTTVDNKDDGIVTNDGAGGSDAVDCEGIFHESSRSYWSANEDGGEVIKGGVGSLLRDRVSANLTSTPYGRAIYVLKNDGTIIDFIPTKTTITNAVLGVADDTERYKIFNYMYGYTYDADSADGNKPTACRNWPLGSFVHSNPSILTYENADKTYIVIGSNDGMLHVFDDDNGEEVAAFIPEYFLGSLKNFNPDPDGDGVESYDDNPLFFIDGQTTLHYNINKATGTIQPSQFIFGLRRGGAHYYSLDITDSTPANWTLKWHIDRSGDFDQLGQTWSKMEIMKLDATHTVGVFGGGYDGAEDTDLTGKSDNEGIGTALYIIDIEKSDTSGIVLIKKTDYNISSNKYMKHSIVADPSLVPNLNGYLSGIYFADVGGQIWHLGYNDSSFDENPRLVFVSNTKSDNGRKMFYSPTVTLLGKCDYRDDKDNARDSMTYVLVVGTGDRANPKETDVNNRIYMIVDSNETSPLTETDLLYDVTDDDIDVDNEDLTEAQKLAMRETMARTNGWYIKLADIYDEDVYGTTHIGEKILAQPIVFYNVAYIPSFTPDTDGDECNPKGLARIYALNYCDGTSAINYYAGNDDIVSGETVEKYNYLDRYRAIGQSIPSSPKILIRDGVAAAFSSVGGGLPGLGKYGTSKIPQPKFSLEMINWRVLVDQN